MILESKSGESSGHKPSKKIFSEVYMMEGKFLLPSTWKQGHRYVGTTVIFFGKPAFPLLTLHNFSDMNSRKLWRWLRKYSFLKYSCRKKELDGDDSLFLFLFLSQPRQQMNSGK